MGDSVVIIHSGEVGDGIGLAVAGAALRTEADNDEDFLTVGDIGAGFDVLLDYPAFFNVRTVCLALDVYSEKVEFVNGFHVVNVVKIGHHEFGTAFFSA